MRSRIYGILLALSILPFILFFAAAQSPAYYLVSHEGFVAVYDVASGQISLCTQTPVDSLPAVDARQIAQGFACADELALAQALENFCS